MSHYDAQLAQDVFHEARVRRDRPGDQEQVQQAPIGRILATTKDVTVSEMQGTTRKANQVGKSPCDLLINLLNA